MWEGGDGSAALSQFRQTLPRAGHHTPARKGGDNAAVRHEHIETLTRRAGRTWITGGEEQRWKVDNIPPKGAPTLLRFDLLVIDLFMAKSLPPLRRRRLRGEIPHLSEPLSRLPPGSPAAPLLDLFQPAASVQKLCWNGLTGGLCFTIKPEACVLLQMEPPTSHKGLKH
ncbi:hypothetical protein C8R44DRAFT_728215 [Mycena epipterygia]|nr:hypothetical protein C8R44DRAFT_728215 [Mycena epipterygia]